MMFKLVVTRNNVFADPGRFIIIIIFPADFPVLTETDCTRN